MFYSTTHLGTTGVINQHQPPSPRGWVTQMHLVSKLITTAIHKDKLTQKQMLCCRPGVSGICWNQHDLSVLQPAKNPHRLKKATPPVTISKHIKLSRWWIKARGLHKKGWWEMANGFIYWPSRAYKSCFPWGWQAFSSSFKWGPMWHAARLNRIISMREDTVR